MKCSWIGRLLVVALVSVIGISSLYFPAQAEEPPLKWYIDIIDITGDSAFDPDDMEFWDVTGHKMYAKIKTAEQVGAVPAVTWKSTNKKVATVDKYGVITCKKKGTTSIIAQSTLDKNDGRLARLAVYENRVDFQFDYGAIDFSEDFGYAAQTKSVYIKSGKIYAECYIYNNTNAPIRRLSPQKVWMTDDYEGNEYGDYKYIGTFPAKLKKKIMPGMVGLATIATSRVKASEVYMTMADVYIEGYCFEKGMSGETAQKRQGYKIVKRLPKNAKRHYRRSVSLPQLP